jgi:hypothetical protein
MEEDILNDLPCSAVFYFQKQNFLEQSTSMHSVCTYILRTNLCRSFSMFFHIKYDK